MENVALRIGQILYTIVLRVENNGPTSQGYIFYSLQHFTTKFSLFTKFRMLFRTVVIFFPISNFFKISSKRLKVHWELGSSCFFLLEEWDSLHWD